MCVCICASAGIPLSELPTWAGGSHPGISTLDVLRGIIKEMEKTPIPNSELFLPWPDVHSKPSTIAPADLIPTTTNM